MNQHPDDARSVIDQRSPRLLLCFAIYLRWYLKRNFHSLRILKTGLPVDAGDKPLVIYSNHPSWWDPLIYILIANQKFSSRIGFGPMELKALENYAFMKRLGIYGVDSESRQGIRTFLRVSKHLLSIPNHCLWVSAQGEFSDPRSRPLGLRPGISYLLKNCPESIFMPMAIEYPFWDERYPEALVSFGQPIESVKLKQLPRNNIMSILDSLLCQSMDDLAKMAATREQKHFETVLEGNYGVGGIYHLTQQLKARFFGKSYHPKHGDIKINE